jgi:hypothetical protein
MTAPPFSLALLLCTAAAALLACGPDAGGSAPGALTTCPITSPPATPTFEANVLPAIQASCGRASTSCHGPPSGGELPKGKVNFSTAGGRTAADVYGDLVNQPPANSPPGYLLVKPADPVHSWLVVKITQDDPGGAGSAYGARMPFSGANLCQATIDTFVAWIQQGAAP